MSGDRDEIWRYDISRNALTQLTYDGGFAPAWTHDGARIIFGATRGGPADLFWRRVSDGSDERLIRTSRIEVPHSISPDGRWLAFVEYDASSSHDISLLALDERSVRPFLATPATETAPLLGRRSMARVRVGPRGAQRGVRRGYRRPTTPDTGLQRRRHRAALEPRRP
jgi:Tol biopolymer transport system component